MKITVEHLSQVAAVPIRAARRYMKGHFLSTGVDTFEASPEQIRRATEQLRGQRRVAVNDVALSINQRMTWRQR